MIDMKKTTKKQNEDFEKEFDEFAKTLPRDENGKIKREITKYPGMVFIQLDRDKEKNINTSIKPVMPTLQQIAEELKKQFKQ